MEKVVRLSRNHWKKLSITSIVVSCGIYYVAKQYQQSFHMRHVCNVAAQYPILKNKNVLVILNPTANRKRSEKMFQEYCEPVLHMAGYVVEIVKTNHIGHAKSLMEELQQLPDAVVVAGGDGTSSEVVTGLIRRNKEMCPILFLPLGEKNETATNLMELNVKSELVKKLTGCMLALIQGRVEHRPVIKCELIETHNCEHRKPIFGVFSFSWGVIKDAELNKEKYWYFGALKHFVSIIVLFLSNQFEKNIIANICSIPPCSGCQNCEPIERNSYWFNIPKIVNSNIASRKATQLKEQNLCSRDECYEINAKQMDIVCMQSAEFVTVLKTRIVDNIYSRTQFLINMIAKEEYATILLQSRSIEVVPSASQNQPYYIDGESYDARHVKISILPNALKYFF